MKFKIKKPKLLFPILLLLPAVITLGFFAGYPLLWNVWKSLVKDGVFVGLANFQEAVSYMYFARSLFVTIQWITVTTISTFLYALLGALLLNRKFKGRAFVQIFLLIPFFVPEFVSAINFMWLYHPMFGIFNEILSRLGLISSYQAWLSNPDTALYAVAVSYIWRLGPYQTLILLAGLLTINEELYEAAKVDGAGMWHLFRHITIPQLAPVIALVILFLTISSAETFTRIYIMTGGGPMRSTETVSIFIFNQSFAAFNFERAACAAFILSGLILCLAVINLYLRRRIRIQ